MKLTNATPVTATRAGTATQSTDAGFVAVEFNSAKLQNGVVEYVEIDLSGVSSNTGAIASIDTAKTFLAYAGMLRSSANDNRDFARIALTNATTVTANAGRTQSGTTKIAAYVIPLSTMKTLNRNAVAFGSGATQVDTTITSVSTSKTFVSYLGQTSASNTAARFDFGLARVGLNSSTAVRQNRVTAENSTTTVSWEAIESA